MKISMLNSAETVTGREGDLLTFFQVAILLSS